MAEAALDHLGLGFKAVSGLGCAAGVLWAVHRHLVFTEEMLSSTPSLLTHGT